MRWGERSFRVRFAVGIVAGLVGCVVAVLVLTGFLPPPRSTTHPQAWDRVEVDLRRPALVVHYLDGSCVTTKDVEAREFDDRIVVTRVVREVHTTCTAIGYERSRQVRLRAPAADRRIVDGACLEPAGPACDRVEAATVSYEPACEFLSPASFRVRDDGSATLIEALAPAGGACRFDGRADLAPAGASPGRRPWGISEPIVTPLPTSKSERVVASWRWENWCDRRDGIALHVSPDPAAPRTPVAAEVLPDCVDAAVESSLSRISN